MINPKLIKWVNASINKYFDDARGSYPLYIAGQNLAPIKSPAWCELHYSVGPDIEETNKDSFTISVTLTLMCSVVPSNTNKFLIHDLAGYFANLASQNIPVKTYGENTETFIECLQPVDRCRIQQWGSVQVMAGTTPIDVTQTHVEASYYLRI